MGNIAKKSWETIIEHAKACDIDDGKHYTYHYPTAEQPMISLLFNSIYKLEEVSFGGHNYRSLESLNSEEKVYVFILLFYILIHWAVNSILYLILLHHI